MESVQHTNGKGTAHAPTHAVLPLSQIDESPTNPRKTFAAVEELAADIKMHGVLQDVLVRPRAKGRYELVFGARRYRAAKLAGLKEIPAKVRDLDDATTLEIQIVENSKRADIHPLEEADGYEQLHTKHGLSVEDIAAKVGKSVATVRARLKLSAIAPAVRDAVFAERITLGAALVLARLASHDVQAKALKDATEQWRKGEAPVSERDVAWRVKSRFMLRLADAPFDRADAGLVAGAPACSACPKRTGNQRELFGDLDGERDDLCTDAKCFGEKKDAAWAKRVEAAKAKGHDVLPEKKAKSLFYGRHLKSDAAYVDLKAENYSDPKGRTNKAILGKADVPVVIARDEDGGIHELVPVEEFRKAVGAKAQVGKTTDDVAKKARERAAREKEKFAEAMGELVGKVERRQPTDAFWRALARCLVRGASADTRVAICRRRTIEFPKSANGGFSEGPMKALFSSLAAMTGDEVRGLCVELTATNYGGAADPSFKELSALFAPKAPAGKKKGKAKR